LDSQRGLRYRAARAAAQASVGVGDGANLGDDERARWRQQALAWLRADLDAAAGQLEGASKAQAFQLISSLSAWRGEADLAPFLGPEALDKLPPAEAREWLAMWRDLDARYRLAIHRIFRTAVFSLRMGYRTGRLELYAARRPACFGDFFLPP
jgi:hypothetical protein